MNNDAKWKAYTAYICRRHFRVGYSVNPNELRQLLESLGVRLDAVEKLVEELADEDDGVEKNDESIPF